jgi:uncharacterized DUF497 family protein
MGLRFEWDDIKARSNLSKHAISFAEASTVFSDLNSITIADPAHSSSEVRHVILGHSYTGKLIVVVHTERGENVRIISARAANRKEKRTYEENF